MESRGEERRRQFDRMARLARAYRGWTMGEFNDALGRGAARPAPDGSDPKLDLVARLALALDWDIGEVAERMWQAGGEPEAGRGAVREALGFADLDARAQVEHRAGDFAAMERTARAMRTAAATGRERAVAANRLAGALDGTGRYARALEVLRAALDEPEVGADVRLMLSVNVANANYTLWHLHEARALAEGVLERFASDAPRTRLERVAQAFGHAIVGHATRRMIGRCDSPVERVRHAQRAHEALASAESCYRALFDAHGDAQYEGLAHVARGGVIEARVAAGTLSADDGLGEVLAELDRFVDLESMPSGHLIESAGWWSVFGANIAMRAGAAEAREIAEVTGRGAHGDDAARATDADRAFAVCTNKAFDVGERLGHWPLRERAFTLEWFRRQRGARTTAAAAARAWTLDRDDLRALVGAMGRFPFFRPTGWAIIDGAAIML